MVHIHLEGRDMAEIKAQVLDLLSISMLTIPAQGAEEAPNEAPVAAQETPKAHVQETPKVEMADVRKACLAYREKNGQAALVAVFEKLGAKKLPDIPPERYGELMELVS